MDVINLKHGVAPSTSLTIYRYGATITSWSVDGHENLFLSSKAVLDGTKAIRGGIPICFPSFGPWKYGPAHGLARYLIQYSLASKQTQISEGYRQTGRCSEIPRLMQLVEMFM